MKIIIKDKTVKVDDEDLEKISHHKWFLSKFGYVWANMYVGGKRKSVGMSSFVLGFNSDRKTGLEIDHINHNKLDNRKHNLRIVTRSENNLNRRTKGYSFIRAKNLYKIFCLSKYQGYAKTEEEAIKKVLNLREARCVYNWTQQTRQSRSRVTLN